MENTIALKAGEYNCPNCGRGYIPQNMVHRTEPEFNDGGEHDDPHYEWMEIHECDMCETLYSLDNRT